MSKTKRIARRDREIARLREALSLLLTLPRMSLWDRDGRIFYLTGLDELNMLHLVPSDVVYKINTCESLQDLISCRLQEERRDGQLSNT